MKERIKKLRTVLGLTMEKFGNELGVGKTAISKLESGERNLTDQMFKAICNVNWDGKHVNADWLRGDSDEMFLIDPDDELNALKEKYRMSDTEYAFLKEFFKLEPSRRENFFETLDKVFFAVHAGDVPEVVSESIEELEERYKKSRSASAPKTALPASSITSGKKKDA